MFSLPQLYIYYWLFPPPFILVPILLFFIFPGSYLSSLYFSWFLFYFPLSFLDPIYLLFSFPGSYSPFLYLSWILFIFSSFFLVPILLSFIFPGSYLSSLFIFRFKRYHFTLFMSIFFVEYYGSIVYNSLQSINLFRKIPWNCLSLYLLHICLLCVITISISTSFLSIPWNCPSLHLLHIYLLRVLTRFCILSILMYSMEYPGSISSRY